MRRLLRPGLLQPLARRRSSSSAGRVGSVVKGATATAAAATARRPTALPALVLPIRRGFASTTTPASSASGHMSIQASIEAKLQEGLQPTHMQVLNESYMHNVPKGAETHFKVVLVAAAFEGKPLLGRHRLVNALLDAELKDGVHALSIVAKTPGEWAASAGAVPPSPQCRGGSKH